jgi:hypothetical protein
VSDPLHAAGGRTLRATSSVVSFGALVLCGVFLIGDAAVRGYWDVVARWLPVVLFALWVFWLTLVRSSIRVERERVVVINLLRVHEVPWSRVAECVQTGQIRLDLVDGRRLTCWGGPFPSRRGMSRGPVDSDAVDLMEAMRLSAPASGEPLRAHWDMPSLLVGGILLVWAALSVALVST